MTSYLSKNKNEFKALILAGGRGKRLDKYTKDENKCMLKFHGKPLIEYSLEKSLDMGVKEIIIVVGYLAENIINYYGNNYKGIIIKYVIQKEQKGLVNAIDIARKSIENSDFFLLLGDEFFLQTEHDKLIELFYKENAMGVCGMIEVEDKSQINKTYSILFDQDSKKIFRLVEKPKNPFNNLMGTGNVLFNNKILDYIKMTPINQNRKEAELPDLIQCAIDDGKKIFYYTLSSVYVNINTSEDITILNKEIKIR